MNSKEHWLSFASTFRTNSFLIDLNGGTYILDRLLRSLKEHADSDKDVSNGEALTKRLFRQEYPSSFSKATEEREEVRLLYVPGHIGSFDPQFTPTKTAMAMHSTADSKETLRSGRTV